MWYQIQQILSPLFRYLSHLNRQEWTVLFVIALIIGSFCMRGFGSRTNY